MSAYMSFLSPPAYLYTLLLPRPLSPPLTLTLPPYVVTDALS